MKRVTVGRVLVGVFLVACAGAIAVGLGVIDSPWIAREKKFDTHRSSDLGALSLDIWDYWDANGRVPETLDALGPGAISYRSDPVTGTVYEYRVLAEDRYELCATFTHERDCHCDMGFDVQDFYFHGAGRQCYERTVPPDQGE